MDAAGRVEGQVEFVKGGLEARLGGGGERETRTKDEGMDERMDQAVEAEENGDEENGDEETVEETVEETAWRRVCNETCTRRGATVEDGLIELTRLERDVRRWRPRTSSNGSFTLQILKFHRAFDLSHTSCADLLAIRDPSRSQSYSAWLALYLRPVAEPPSLPPSLPGVFVRFAQDETTLESSIVAFGCILASICAGRDGRKCRRRQFVPILNAGAFGDTAAQFQSSKKGRRTWHEVEREGSGGGTRE